MVSGADPVVTWLSDGKADTSRQFISGSFME
jgi:hypothetical protein